VHPPAFGVLPDSDNVLVHHHHGLERALDEHPLLLACEDPLNFQGQDLLHLLELDLFGIAFISMANYEAELGKLIDAHQGLTRNGYSESGFDPTLIIQ
jgi:hypothetical protein